MNIVLMGILAYVVAQLAIGFLVTRSIRTESDYLLAGRKLGYILATFSIFATWFGAESCIGTAGAAYSEGLAGVSADPFGYGICLFLMGLLFAMPLWRMKLTTIADFFSRRFSTSTERLTAILMVPTSILWAAAQIRAFGQVLSASSDIGLTIAVTISAAVVITYTVSGGMLADAITDLLQGVVLIIGLAILLPAIVGDVGGASAAISMIPQGKLSFGSIQGEGGVWRMLASAESWAIPICGSIIAQELVSRVIASRSGVVARRSSLIAACLYILVGLIPLTLGLMGSSMIIGLEHPEQILPMLAQQHLSTLGYVIFAGALISAILSTVDSALLSASGLLLHNVIIPLIPQVSEAHKVRLERLGVVVMGVSSFVLALYAEGVYKLVKDASSFGSAGIFVVFMFGMFSRIGSVKSALSTLITGALIWVLGHYVFEFELSYLLALACSLLVYLSLAAVKRERISTSRSRAEIQD